MKYVLLLLTACAPVRPPDPWPMQKEHCAVYQVHGTNQCFKSIKGEPPEAVSCDTQCPHE